MTAPFLQSALTSLISDSKKKFSDVRSAAEKSLADLKSIAVTSETQLGGDLSRRSDFIEPFVLACQTKHVKLAVSGATCLQRLIASRAVPRDRLYYVLYAYWEAVDLSYEVQLKILQTLPALLQLYGDDVHGEMLARVLNICATLQANRIPLVANSAGATLDQLIESIFEQAEGALRFTKRNASKDAESQPDSDNSAASISDACKLFKDFCTLLNHGPPSFLVADSLPPLCLLRVLQKTLEGHGNFVRSTGELVDACRTELLPAIEQLLNGKDDFLIVVHSTRLTYILLQKLSAYLVQDTTPVLRQFLTFADRDGGPLWKRCLSLELFRNLLTNFGILMRIFASSQDGTGNIIAGLVATLVRIAAEDPTLIGMGRQSTMPAQRGNELREDEMASIEAQGIGGGGLASVNSAEAGVTGIGLDFSTLERPLIDAEDSAGPSEVPKTYIYTLILGSISYLCEGLSKFIMPLSVANRQSEPELAGSDEPADDDASEQGVQPRIKARDMPRHKYQRLANPLKMTQLPQLTQVQTCARMIDQCWPAVLATSSTFLNAALDSHFYHVLIRSMQKLAQVSGTLELSTPRDALLTSLAKGSVPANAASIIALSQPAAHSEGPEIGESPADGFKSPATDGTRHPIDTRKQSLNVRHLLCLRALLNLGIALGPSLGQEAWFIFVETLQQVEGLMSISRSGAPVSAAMSRLDGAQDGQTTLASEMIAVTTASRRMFDSTRGYSAEAFSALVTAIFRLMGDTTHSITMTGAEAPSGQLASPTTLDTSIKSHGHRTTRSVSGLWTKTKALDMEMTFVLAKIKDLSHINLSRFATPEAWDLIPAQLLKLSQNPDLAPNLRVEAAEILDLVCMEAIKLEADDTTLVQSKSLSALKSQMSSSLDSTKSSTPSHLRRELGQRVFEALEDILGHCGESLTQWPTVFAILEAGVHQGITAAAFRCVQLICNDFMPTLSSGVLASLVSLMANFADQKDTNMALTTATLLRNISTLLQERIETLDLSSFVNTEGTSRSGFSTAEEVSRLWFSTIEQLSRLCVDSRRDVRDASVRILVQALDGSGDLLIPISWRILLKETFISLIRDYLREMHGTVAGAWENTCIYLTEAYTELIKDHLSSIALDPGFQETWNNLLGAFDAEIQYPTFQMYAVGLNSISILLKTMSGFEMDHEPYVVGTLAVWSARPPSTLRAESSGPNQAAITAHATMLNIADATSPNAVRYFHYQDKTMDMLVRTATQESILGATHSPYTNDIKKMTAEQATIFGNIGILKRLMHTNMDQFTTFVTGLIENMLLHPSAARSDQPAASKKIERPKFVAISSACLGLLRELIQENGSLWFDVCPTLRMLAAIIDTKYTAVPTDSEAPLWKEATVTAAVFVEALRAALPSNNFDQIAESIIVLLSAVMGAGGLWDARSSSISTETLSVDEDFDISYFTRIHSASISLLSLPAIPDTKHKRYVLVIFKASILAGPWFNDFPDDLIGQPLKGLGTLRRGSVYAPTFARRRKIVYASLTALFDLVNLSSSATSTSAYNPLLAITAFPYLLLRIAHPIRVFLADQPLRGLTPFPKAQQVELEWILRKSLELRCDDDAFAMALKEVESPGSASAPAKSSGRGANGDAGRGQPHDNQSQLRQNKQNAHMMGGHFGDGKSHLRALYKMVLRLHKEWYGMMRMKDGMSWQGEVEGKGIEECMERWVEIVGDSWAI